MEEKPTFALKYVALAVLVAFAIGIVIGVVARAKFAPCVITPTISIQRDTIYKRDTIHGKPVEVKSVRTILRHDTLELPSTPDTSHTRDVDTSRAVRLLPSGSVSVPIEQRTYATQDYRAVVSGWHPSLDSITIYAKTKIITNTVTKLADPPRRNWAIVVGPAALYGFDKKIVPGASVTLGFVVKSWH